MNFVQDKNKYNTSHITQNVSVFNSDVNNICERYIYICTSKHSDTEEEIQVSLNLIPESVSQTVRLG